jgi:rubrerythrin
MKLQNAEGRELAEEEIEALSGGAVFLNCYFKCVTCNAIIRYMPTKDEVCPKCGWDAFKLVTPE